MLARTALASILALAFGGCTVHPPVSSGTDAGTDARVRDDANLARDVGTGDAPSLPDTGAADAGGVDGGADAGGVDAGGTDAGGVDAGTDAGRADAGGVDAGTDAGTDASSPVDAGHDAAIPTLPGVLNETDLAAEADYCVLQFPASTSAGIGAASAPIYGRLYEGGRTDVSSGAAPGVVAELGYGPAGTDPRTSTAWVFHRTTFNVETDGNNNDEYGGSLTISVAGTYAYAYRFSFDDGANVTYCDLDGAGSNPGLSFSPTQLGTITVP